MSLRISKYLFCAGQVARNTSYHIIIITTLIGTSVFASLTAETIGPYEKIVVGMLSVVAAVLASLQTFFNYTEKSEKHRTAAARFGTVRRKFEAIYAQRSQAYDENKVSALREELDRLAEDLPAVPVSIFDRVQKNIYYTDGSEAAPLQNPVASREA